MVESDDREFLRKVAEAYPRVGGEDREAKDRLIGLIRAGQPRRRVGVASRIAWPWSRAPELGISWQAAASVALVLAFGVAIGWTARDRWSGAPDRAGSMGEDLTRLQTTSEVRLVQFVITAPGASRVAVVGDFNDWDPAAAPMQQRAGGSWTAAIPLPPGRHVYAFVVDGDHWLPDPSAPLAPEDGFGSRNSVIVVGGMEST